MGRTAYCVDELVCDLEDMSSRKWEETHLSVDHVVQGGATEFKDDAMKATMRPGGLNFGKESALDGRGELLR